MTKKKPIHLRRTVNLKGIETGQYYVNNAPRPDGGRGSAALGTDLQEARAKAAKLMGRTIDEILPPRQRNPESVDVTVNPTTPDQLAALNRHIELTESHIDELKSTLAQAYSSRIGATIDMDWSYCFACGRHIVWRHTHRLCYACNPQQKHD